MKHETSTDLSAVTGASRLPLRLLPAAKAGINQLRIAVLAPPWIPVPPPAYGGIEVVVGLLCATLVAAVGIFAHVSAIDLGTAPLVKAGQQTAVSGHLPAIR